MTLFLKNLEEHSELIAKLYALDAAVLQLGKIAAEKLAGGGKVLLCGNGGSAADCQHIAAELTGRFVKERKPLSAIALTTDTSALTCIGNDYAFDEIFARQVGAIGRSNDLLLGLSTSGNSINVIRAVEEASKRGITTVGLLGRDGGKLAGLCDHAIIIPSNVTARIQECHILVGHTLCGLIEQNLGLA